MVEKDRMCLARVRPPQDDEIGFFALFIGTRTASRTENCRQTGDTGRVSSAVTAIDIVTADHQARKLLGHEVRLVCRF
jgi:hypothetical protein